MSPLLPFVTSYSLMNYFSICDGIGASHCGLQPLGFQYVGVVSEIDKYCNQLINQKYGTEIMATSQNGGNGGGLAPTLSLAELPVRLSVFWGDARERTTRRENLPSLLYDLCANISHDGFVGRMYRVQCLSLGEGYLNGCATNFKIRAWHAACKFFYHPRHFRVFSGSSCTFPAIALIVSLGHCNQF